MNFLEKNIKEKLNKISLKSKQSDEDANTGYFLQSSSTTPSKEKFKYA